ncbi:MAG: LysE family translocator [Kineosporiaceae bacterium]
MTPLTALSFAGAAGLIVIVPGPDQALLLRTTAGAGRAAAVRTALGIIAGIVVWGVASGVGLAAIVTNSPRAFRVLSVAGALYLLWLAAQAVRSALRAASDDGRVPPGLERGHFRRGLTTNLLNPKIGLLYLSIVPGFLPRDGSAALGDQVLLYAIYILESTLWLLGFAFAAGSLYPVLNRPRVRRTLDALVGVVLAALGVVVLVEA